MPELPLLVVEGALRVGLLALAFLLGLSILRSIGR